MKILNNIFLLMLLALGSCSTTNFDEIEAKKTVRLNQEDLEDYNMLYGFIIDDLKEIRQAMKPLHHSIDTTFLNTNSYYLYKIDKAKYEPLIIKLQNKGIYADQIHCGVKGTVTFQLKEMTNVKWDDYNDSHFHEIVFNEGLDQLNQDNYQVVIDSLITENIKYMYLTAKTGH